MRKLLIIFLSLSLLVGCGPHKDTPTINKTTPMKNSSSKTDQTPRPAASRSVPDEYRKPLLDRFMDVATDEEFFRIFSAVQPVKKVDFPHPDEVFTVSNACAILYGNPVKGPLKIKVFESERQITIDGFPLFVWDGVAPSPGSFHTELSKFVQTYLINHGDVAAQQQAAYEEQFKIIQEKANSIPNYSDEAWEVFIRAELDKMDLPGKWIKVYPTTLFGLYNPCLNRQFPRLRVNYRLDFLEPDYEFRSELHHSWDQIVEKCGRLTIPSESKIAEKRQGKFDDYRRLLSGLFQEQAKTKPQGIIATNYQIKLADDTCELIDAFAKVTAEPAASKRDRFRRLVKEITNPHHDLIDSEAVRVANGILIR